MKQRKQKAPRTMALLGFAVAVMCLLASGIGKGAAEDVAVTGTPTATMERMAELESRAAELAQENERLKAELWRLDELMEQGNADGLPELDAAEVEMLACAIYCEAGGDACSDLCRLYVGDVILNRVDDPRFPDTMAEVLTAEGQYGRFHWTGIVWPNRASCPGEAAAVARAYDTARALLSGEHSGLYLAGGI